MGVFENFFELFSMIIQYSRVVYFSNDIQLGRVNWSFWQAPHVDMNEKPTYPWSEWIDLSGGDL